MIFFRLRLWLIIVVSVGIWQYRADILEQINRSLAQPPPLESVVQDQVRRVVGYKLKTDGWLVFPLVLNGDIIRVFSNGEVSSSEKPPEANDWNYAINYRLLDGEGKTIIEDVYTHHTRLTQFRIPGNEKLYTPAFFHTPHSVLSDTRSFPLNVVAQKRPLTLWIKLKEQDSMFRDILVRISMQERIDEDKVPTLWHRLKPEAREDVSKATLYPADLLQDRERNNLMRDMWRPQGPRGVPGSDYTVRPFLVWEEAAENKFEMPFVQQMGLQFGEGWAGVIPVPEKGGKIRLEIIPGQGVEAKEIPVAIRWQGRLAKERATYKKVWRNEHLTVEIPRGGLLQLTSPVSLVVRAFLTDSGTEQEITPQPRSAAFWAVDVTHTLRFPVYSNSLKNSTPYRLNIRTVSGPDILPSPNDRKASWSFLGIDGQALKSGIVHWQPEVSIFDRVKKSIAVDESISEPFKSYLMAPLKSHTLEITSKHPIWVSLANRPATLQKHVRIPEDAYPTKDHQPMPAWLPLRPKGWRDAQKEGKFLLVSVQRRPTDDELDGVMDPGGWLGHEPVDGTMGRYILMPRDKMAAPLPSTGRGSGYEGIIANRRTKLTLHGEPGREKISPTLIYRRLKKGAPTPLKVHVNESLFLQTKLPGISGKIRLPKLPTGTLNIRLETNPGVRFYLSHAAQPSYIKRYAQRLRVGKPLTYRITKEDATKPLVLSGRLFAPQGSQQRSILESHLLIDQRSTKSAQLQWTIASRSYDIRPPSGSPSQVLGAGGEIVDGGQPFFIPLGTDLKSGSQTIKLMLESGPARYLVLGETRSGPIEERLIFLEESSP
jgi:hypothetical protein